MEGKYDRIIGEIETILGQARVVDNSVVVKLEDDVDPEDLGRPRHRDYVVLSLPKY